MAAKVQKKIHNQWCLFHKYFVPLHPQLAIRPPKQGLDARESGENPGQYLLL
jgi:hypothetical protein